MTKDKTEEQTIENSNEELENLKAELKLEKEQRLLALADLENYRKRVESERSESMKYATMSLLRDIAEVVDDFERMIQDLDEPEKEDKVDAFKPVLDKLKGLLIDNMLVEINVNSGDKFDPNTMEAIGTVPVETEEQHNTVIHVAQRGYRFQGESGQILRHGKVLVGKYTAQ